jgi:hypothetical protein
MIGRKLRRLHRLLTFHSLSFEKRRA